MPDLRAFGGCDEHDVKPADHYGAAGQVRSVASLMDELGIDEVVLTG